MGRCCTERNGLIEDERVGSRAFGAADDSVAEGMGGRGKVKTGRARRTGKRWGKKGSGGPGTSGSEEGRRRQRSQKREATVGRIG